MKHNYFFLIVLMLCFFMLQLPSDSITQGTHTITISSEKLGGDVHFDASLDEDDFVLTVTYPKTIKSYLGGFKDGLKTYSADIKFFLDVDADPKTGYEADPNFEPGIGGSEFAIEADEVRTSVGRDSDGNWINKPKLLVEVKKDDSYHDLPEGVYPNWEMLVKSAFQEVDWVDPPNSKVMRVRIPASVFGIGKGDKVRVTGLIPLCNKEWPFAGLGEAVIILK